MLGRARIEDLLSAGKAAYTGTVRGDALLVSLGAPVQGFARSDTPVDLADQRDVDRLYGPLRDDWDSYRLDHGDLALCAAAERLRLPVGYVGVLGGLSHVARAGLGVHLTSPFVTGGWDGHVTLELSNSALAPLLLRRGMPVAKITLWEVSGAEGGSPSPYAGEPTRLGSLYPSEFCGDGAGGAPDDL
jgi:deoxycytidine triphosphate deaminase